MTALSLPSPSPFLRRFLPLRRPRLFAPDRRILTAGASVVRPSGARGVKSDGAAAVKNASNQCPECCATCVECGFCNPAYTIDCPSPCHTPQTVRATISDWSYPGCDTYMRYIIGSIDGAWDLTYYTPSGCAWRFLDETGSGLTFERWGLTVDPYSSPPTTSYCSVYICNGDVDWLTYDLGFVWDAHALGGTGAYRLFLIVNGGTPGPRLPDDNGGTCSDVNEPITLFYGWSAPIETTYIDCQTFLTVTNYNPDVTADPATQWAWADAADAAGGVGTYEGYEGAPHCSGTATFEACPE